MSGGVFLAGALHVQSHARSLYVAKVVVLHVLAVVAVAYP